jgi:eukaryotic-like serine/threonine-protein kinase
MGATVAGKYRLDELLGRGGMGSVWRATHLRLGNRVAIKIIAPMYARYPEARQRFDNEAKAAALLRSRHIVQVFDNGELDDDTPFIVMEYLEGQPLSERLAEARAMPPAEAFAWLSQVGRALATAHAAGIVHRDLKPENLFLAKLPDESEVVVKVLDFGIAKFNAEGFERGATQTGAVMGTPVYMSPEQARGLKTVDQRSDLYSLGQVAYTLLTGKTAFEGGSLADVIIEVCTQPLPSLRASAPWLPEALDGWYQKACARDPADRFANVNEFLDAFSAASQSVPAPPQKAQASSTTEVASGLPAAFAYLNQRGVSGGGEAAWVPPAAPSGQRRDAATVHPGGGDTASTPASRTLEGGSTSRAHARIVPLALVACGLFGALGVGAIAFTKLRLATHVSATLPAPKAPMRVAS